MNGFREDALANFYDRDYRESYWEEFLNLWIATQLRALREDRKLTQEGLAELAGMKQSRISALENADYSSWSVTTLRRLAKALGVTLAVEFRSYGKRLIDFERFQRREFDEPEFEKDSLFRVAGLLAPTSPIVPSPDAIRRDETPTAPYEKALGSLAPHVLHPHKPSDYPAFVPMAGRGQMLRPESGQPRELITPGSLDKVTP
jgi:transcriptional regulator with XRE-family HTH domain